MEKLLLLQQLRRRVRWRRADQQLDHIDREVSRGLSGVIFGCPPQIARRMPRQCCGD